MNRLCGHDRVPSNGIWKMLIFYQQNKVPSYKQKVKAAPWSFFLASGTQKSTAIYSRFTQCVLNEALFLDE